MIIKNLKKDANYQLPTEAKIEVERTNPFFNEYGEQTVPLDLPASDYNRRLLGFPDVFGRKAKMEPVDASIQDGEYFAQCRQYILSAQHKGSISTSFYINDGSFYSRIQNVKLKDVFADDVIEFEGSTLADKVEAGIEFCRGLRSGSDERFAIFPVLVDDDSGVDTGFSYKIINAYGKEKTFDVPSEKTDGKEATFTAFDPDDDSSDSDFYNAVQRVEYVDTLAITLEPGYYISPFIRACYVLRRIFEHFGYTMEDNFFTSTAPFKDMVLINTVIDPLVNGKLKLADLLPDITVSDFLSVFRKKFCCEFTSDEGSRKAGIIFLREVLAMAPVADLTDCLVAEPTISYKSEKDFMRAVISSKNVLSSDAESSYDDISALMADNPGAYHDKYTGSFYKVGFSGNYKVYTKVAEASMPYSTGEDTEESKVEVPDCIPEFRTLLYSGTYDSVDFDYTMGTWLYAGTYTTRNSTMQITGEDESETTDSSEEFQAMLAFTYLSGNKPAGTISPYDLQSSEKTKLWDYALYYYGEDGIFERFYRDYDTLMRNAMQTTKMKLLLSQSQKQNLIAYGKVVVRGIAFFINKLKFSLGGKDEPLESEFMTVSLATPVVEAPTVTQMCPVMTTGYTWVGKVEEEETTYKEWTNSGLDKERTFKVVYPPLPTADLEGTIYGKQTSYTEKMVRHGSFWRHAKYAYTKTTCWLECVKGDTV